MDDVATEDLLLATLAGTASSDDRATALSTVLETIGGSGRRLSRQVEVAVAVETLVGEGLLQRENGGDEERLRLTEDGRVRAADAAEAIADRRIEVVDGEGRRDSTVRQAAAAFDRSPVEIATACSEAGVYYHEERVERGGIVDRDAERARLEEVIEGVTETGQGEMVRLVGPGGNGKTTLGETLLAAAGSAVDVATVGCRDAGSEPFEPVRTLLDNLGVADPFAATGFEAEDAESYAAQQTGLFSEITDRLTPESGARVLFFDDVDDADASTWSYLAFLRERLSARPVAVVLAHRPGTLPEDAPIHPGPEETRIEVTGLDRTATADLIERVLGRRGAPSELVEAVHERTGGVPLYVETTVETLIETNQLDPQLQWYPTDPEEFDLPAVAEETVGRQVGMFEDDVREILEWVALARGPVAVSLLQEATAYAPERVATILETLTGLVRHTTRDGEAHVTLRNGVFGDALLEALGSAERERRHGSIARLLEGDTSDGQRTAARAATIAYHYEHGGEPGRSLEWHREAADRATAVYAHETAIEHYYRAIEVARTVEDTEAVLSANERLVEIYTLLGEYEQAERHVRFVRERTDGDATRRAQRVARLAAEIHAARSEYEAAIEAATDALDRGETIEQCRLLGVLARAYEGQSEYDAAEETTGRQRELAATLDSPGLEADAVHRLGRIARHRSDYQRAQACYEESLDSYRAISDRQGEAETLHDLGNVAFRRAEYDRAQDHYERALEIGREIGDRQGVADCLHSLGNVEHRRGEYDRARASYEESIAIRREIGDRHGEANSLTNLGSLAFHQGAYDRARERYEQSRDIQEAIGDRNGEGRNLNNLGNVAFKQGEYDQARAYYEESLEIGRALGDRHGEAKTLANIAFVWKAQGEYGRARAYFEESLALRREIGDRLGEAVSLHNLGFMSRKQGEYDRARECYEESLAIKREIDNPRGEAKSLHDLGLLDAREGAYDRARERYEESLALRRAVGDSEGEAETLIGLGTVARRRGADDRARERYEAARDLARESGHSDAEAMSLRGLCALARRAGADDQASDHVDRALDLIESVGGRSDVEQVRLEAARLALARGDIATARERADRVRETFEELGNPFWVARSRQLLGRIADEAGETALACDHWRAALESFEDLEVPADTVRTLDLLADACRRAGDTTAADEWESTASSILADAPDPTVETRGTAPDAGAPDHGSQP